MNVYVLFENVENETLRDIEQKVIPKIECVIKDMTDEESVSVHLNHAKNLSKDVSIVLDQVPKSYGRFHTKMECLYEIRNKVSEILVPHIENVSTENVSVVADSSFKPTYIALKKNSASSFKSESGTEDVSEFDYEKKAELYAATNPEYTFDRVILPDKVLKKIEESLNIIRYENKVFREWGLYAIQPNPSSALSFYGPSGTGKTMAAEAIANKMGKKILKVSYADIESKFHGEGPKMVKAIFLAAQRDDAILFIDEADSLLSKRLTNVTQGSEQAINSMRSQLLICLEEFRGIVIFATNLVVNYDQAFLTRLISVEFVRPDENCREKIWDVHIKPVNDNGIHIPLAHDVNTKDLAQRFDFCGREIRKAVISACVKVAMEKREIVYQRDFIEAGKIIVEEEKNLENAKSLTISGNQNPAGMQNNDLIKELIKNKIKENNELYAN